MPRDPRFISLLTAYQNRLYAYILSLLADPAAAEEVLGQANLVIWEKADQFEPGTDFEAWVMTIARFQVRAWRTRAGRDRLVFSDDVADRIEAAAADLPAALDARMELLHDCFKQLSARQTELVEQRYAQNRTLEQIAHAAGESKSVIAQALYRARLALVRCMRRKLADGGAA
ncbi:MAG: sigma-70 family RNA polymerase sigma factor [Planctomycetes bacterium]|nr:sigma-70 family RNA polymerase sigma factor [Planctomycetota bacterium]